MSVQTETLAPVLNHSHRCDRCGSRAYVLTILVWGPNDGELYWCAHHYNAHAEALRPLLAALIDERHTLTQHVKDDGHVN
jgi:hypothetical protein